MTLVRPSTGPAPLARSASGSIAVGGARARTARAARIWVEGLHDAALVERVWGHDLRVEGVVVEPMDGLDHLPAAVAGFRPGPRRRLGVLADHLVPGTKESRIAAQVSSDHVLVTGHPYVDIWQAVRPSAVGISAWPDGRPRNGLEGRASAGRSGVPDTATMWGRVNGAVRSFRDLDTPLITAVEALIDFVTAEPAGAHDWPGRTGGPTRPATTAVTTRSQSGPRRGGPTAHRARNGRMICHGGMGVVLDRRAAVHRRTGRR